jgi:glutamate/tyrosine decarboxylase-like PLP-dependent enzyme
MDARGEPGELLTRAAELAIGYLDRLGDRAVAPSADSQQLRAVFGGPQPEHGEDPLALLDELARGAEPGLTASSGPRFFGLAASGTHPVAVAADWLTSAWDQNLNQYMLAPAAAVMEEVAGDWLVELFGLGQHVASIFTAGGTAAHHTALAAARHALLAAEGWDVERRGLYRAPELHVVVGAEAHVTIGLALQYLGLGRERVHTVPADEQGRMRADALVKVLAGCAGPTVVCAQAANSYSGAPDPLAEIATATRAHGGWLHVDGGFGLWVAGSPALRHLVDGISSADSWTTDVHKWLNVPYDSGLALCAHPTALRTALATTAPYLAQSGEADQGFFEWVPEFSRRARGVPAYAVLRALGSRGVAELVERDCRLARRMADVLSAEETVTVLNDVTMNQVLLRCTPEGVSDDVADAVTRAVIAAVQGEGTCWLGGATWRGRPVIRVSVSNWSTTEADVDRSAEAILAAVRRLGAAPPEVVVPLRAQNGAGTPPM